MTFYLRQLITTADRVAQVVGHQCQLQSTSK